MKNPPAERTEHAEHTERTGRMAEIRALHRHLVSAQDTQILKVVAMVDAMPLRGEADSLIAPLRARLAQLRPARPLGAMRLLFVPLDPVLTQPAQWRRGSLGIPRTVIPCLYRQFAARDQALLEAAAREIAGATTDDRALILRIGPQLWDRAADVMANQPPPADWAETTGLTTADHTVIIAGILLIWAHGPAIARMVAAGKIDRAEISAILVDAAHTPDAMGVLVSALLHWLPGAAPLVLDFTSAHAAPTGLPGRTATERAVEHVLDTIEAEQSSPPEGPPSLGRLRQVVEMLDELAASSSDRPSRSARIAATRGRVDAACRQRFQSQLKDKVIEHLATGLPSTAEGMQSLETAARDLRRFETVARRINNSDHYDRLLRGTMALLAPRTHDDVQGRVDRLRLAEILLGPEQALQMLVEAEPAAP